MKGKYFLAALLTLAVLLALTGCVTINPPGAAPAPESEAPPPLAPAPTPPLPPAPPGAMPSEEGAPTPPSPPPASSEASINHAPNTPSNPSPANHATDVSTNTLSWSGGDPDPDDRITYDVYFGSTSAPPLVSSHQSATEYYEPPSSLPMSPKYYWKIVATDNRGTSTEGPLWEFTMKGPESEPFITACTPTGPLSGEVNEALRFSTSASSNVAGTPEYRFDWDDGSYSNWSSSPDASHSWVNPGTYMIRAQVRYPGIASEWSSGKSVTVRLPASLPISAELNLATYDEDEIEEFDYPEYSSATKGCFHVSSVVPLDEGQSVTLMVESDCPIHFRWFYPDNPQAEMCISFDRVGGRGSLSGEQPSFFNGGQAAQLVVAATNDSCLARLAAWNHDSDSSHYLKYSIVDGIASPPGNWIPSAPSPITLDRSPGDPEIMKCYITPDDPRVREAVEDILSGSWRWAYNDFNALREWVSMHVSYVSDQSTHSTSEYWQLPAETLNLGTGDCEDFAILLCTLIRAYGVPPDQVYVAAAFSEGEEHGHAFLFEHCYKGIWRAIEPQAGVWHVFVFGDIDPSTYDRFYCFNDQGYLTDKPALPQGVYEFEVDYSSWPISPGASVEFQRYLNATERVTGCIEWGKDSLGEYSNIVYDWTITAYDEQDNVVFTWSGTELNHDFSFTAPQAGIYTIKILKRDYLARCATMTIEPTEWTGK